MSKEKRQEISKRAAFSSRCFVLAVSRAKREYLWMIVGDDNDEEDEDVRIAEAEEGEKICRGKLKATERASIPPDRGEKGGETSSGPLGTATEQEN